jgi:hypothetical protein
MEPIAATNNTAPDTFPSTNVLPGASARSAFGVEKPLSKKSSDGDEHAKWTDVVVALSGVVNLVLVIAISWLQLWDLKRERRRSEKERRKQRIREAKVFWMEEIILRSAVPVLQRTLADYAEKIRTYHAGKVRTADEKGTEIRLWRHHLDDFRISLVEPGQHVCPKEFARIAEIFEGFEDVVTTEFSRDGQVQDGGDPAEKAFAKFNTLRNELNSVLYAAHMLIFKEEPL